LSYRVEKNGGIVNAETGLKSDILIQIPNGPKSDAVQKMKILMMRMKWKSEF
jgi:ATP-dependent Clp protease ATP-binding subunit ClpB